LLNWIGSKMILFSLITEFGDSFSGIKRVLIKNKKGRKKYGRCIYV